MGSGLRALRQTLVKCGEQGLEKPPVLPAILLCTQNDKYKLAACGEGRTPFDADDWCSRRSRAEFCTARFAGSGSARRARAQVFHLQIPSSALTDSWWLPFDDRSQQAEYCTRRPSFLHLDNKCQQQIVLAPQRAGHAGFSCPIRYVSVLFATSGQQHIESASSWHSKIRLSGIKGIEGVENTGRFMGALCRYATH